MLAFLVSFIALLFVLDLVGLKPIEKLEQLWERVMVLTDPSDAVMVSKTNTGSTRRS